MVGFVRCVCSVFYGWHTRTVYHLPIIYLSCFLSRKLAHQFYPPSKAE